MGLSVVPALVPTPMQTARFSLPPPPPRVASDQGQRGGRMDMPGAAAGPGNSLHVSTALPCRLHLLRSRVCLRPGDTCSTYLPRGPPSSAWSPVVAPVSFMQHARGGRWPSECPRQAHLTAWPWAAWP